MRKTAGVDVAWGANQNCCHAALARDNPAHGCATAVVKKVYSCQGPRAGPGPGGAVSDHRRMRDTRTGVRPPPQAPRRQLESPSVESVQPW